MALIIFDLDGTLIDSVEGLGVSMNMVLKELDLPVHPIKKYKDFVGHGFEKLVEQALPDHKKMVVEEAINRMGHYYSIHYNDGMKIYDGILTLLDELVALGFEIGLITNKRQDMADVIVQKYFAHYPWIKVVGLSDAYPAKPNPAKVLEMVGISGSKLEGTYMVGDTEVDIEVARNAGINEVFVTWGFRDLAQMQGLDLKNTIDHPRDLLQIIKISK